MSPRFSAYLDVVRFLAAMIVFLGHASGTYWTGGFLWQFGSYGSICVVIFFVLSGFVIAYVTDQKELSWQVYASNRIARLWSVVIPALLLTFVIDQIGLKVAPDLYLGREWYAEGDASLRYLTSLFMVHDVWELKLVPGINAPFWSLSFEAFYYLGFGIFLFVKKPLLKFSLLLFVALLAGPVISLLSVTWALGWLAYVLKKRIDIPFTVSMISFVLGLSVLVYLPLAKIPEIEVLGAKIVVQFIAAMAFFIHLIGAFGLTKSSLPLPNKLSAFIKTTASTTFALYLLHRPLIQFFSYVGPENASSIGRRVIVIAGTLAFVFIATPGTEMLRVYLRKKCFKYFSGKTFASAFCPNSL